VVVQGPTQMVSVLYEQAGGSIENAIAKRKRSDYQTTIVVNNGQYFA